MREVILAILNKHQIIFRGNREIVAMEIEKALKEWSQELPPKSDKGFMCALDIDKRCDTQCFTCSEDEKCDKENLTKPLNSDNPNGNSKT